MNYTAMNKKEAVDDKEVDESMRRYTKKARPGTAGTSSRCRQFGSPHHRNNTQQNQEIDEMLSPSFAKANLDDADRWSDSDLSTNGSPPSQSDDNEDDADRRSDSDLSTNGSPPSQSDDSEDDEYNDSDNSDDSEDEYHVADPSNTDDMIGHFMKEDDDDDLNKEEVINNLIADCEHDSGLDEEDGDSKQHSNNENVRRTEDTAFNIRSGSFETRYKELQTIANAVDVNEQGLIGVIALLVKFIQEIDISEYSGEKLKSLFNEKRDVIGEAMIEALKEKGHEELAVNLGSQFSLHTAIAFYLHYAPSGSKPVDDDKFDYCRPDQCCIHTMMSKLLNFLINEQKYGPEQMEKWKFGGKSDVNKSSEMVVVDLMPVLLEKRDTDADMVKQYTDVAGKFGLDTYLDLMVISYCMMQMHVLLSRKRQPGKVLQVHVASSATAKYVFGFPNGTVKYLLRIDSPTFLLTIGLHPQAWLMGICKNETVYPKSLQKVMTKHLLGVYQAVYSLDTEFDSTIMETFGRECSGVEMGMHNYVAKVLDEVGALSLDTDIEADDSQMVKRYLSEKGVSEVITNFLLQEMKAYSLPLIMKRMRSFRAAHRMPFIASQIPRDATTFTSLPAQLKCMISALSSILNKTAEQVFQSLRNIAQSYSNSKLLFQLAVVFNDAGGVDGDGHDTLVGHPAFDEYVNASGLGRDEVIEKVKGIARSYSNKKLLYQLAKIFNNAGGGEGNGHDSLVGHPDFQEYVDASGLGRDEAIKKVKGIAQSFDKTFWDNYKVLKDYRNTFEEDVVVVDGVHILTVDRYRDNGKYHNLYVWMNTMNGYSNSMTKQENMYGLKAYQRMGSVEQVALANLDVCFNPSMHKKAIEQRVINKMAASQDEEGTRSDVMSWLD